MMQEINIPRGTTMCLGIEIKNEDGTAYTPASGDILRFGVKLDPDDNSYVIGKTGDYDSTRGCYTVMIEPEDTASLLMDERYWYDVGVQTADGDYYMVVEASPFNVHIAITKKVTS